MLLLPMCRTWHRHCRWEWWNLWFELALLLALFITCFMEAAFKRGRMCFLAFFTLATQGLMWSTHNFLTQIEVNSPVNVRDLGQDAINAGRRGSGKDGCTGPAGQSQAPGRLLAVQQFAGRAATLAGDMHDVNMRFVSSSKQFGCACMLQDIARMELSTALDPWHGHARFLQDCSIECILCIAP